MPLLNHGQEKMASLFFTMFVQYCTKLEKLRLRLFNALNRKQPAFNVLIHNNLVLNCYVFPRAASLPRSTSRAELGRAPQDSRFTN
jgi:hypothetical protein